MCPIIASEGGAGAFVPHPEGQFNAVCCDIEDLGMMESKFKDEHGNQRPDQHKIRVYWLTTAKMDDGRPFIAAKLYTLSLHEKANLRIDLEAWRGRAFTAHELAGFDVEVLIGVPAYLQIQHVQKGDKVYANVVSLMKAIPSLPLPEIPDDYVRKQDRSDQPDVPATMAQPAPPASDRGAPDPFAGVDPKDLPADHPNYCPF